MVLIVAACSKEPRYVINGRIEGADSVTFLLQKREEGRMVTIDSAMALKGSFKMKGGAVRYPEMVLLTAAETRLRTSFYLENSEITITGKLDSLYAAEITGSKSHDEYKGLVESSKVLNDRYTSLYNEYQMAAAFAVASLLVDLHKRQQSILIVVTHNLELAQRMDTRYMLGDARLVAR